jgi:hypothetical protein
MASRRALTSPGGISKPVFSWTTRSRSPPTSPATTGRPYAIASAQTTPKPSSAMGRRSPLPDRGAERAHRAHEAERPRYLFAQRTVPRHRRAAGHRRRRRSPARPSRARVDPRRGSRPARLPPPPLPAGRPRSELSARLARRRRRASSASAAEGAITSRARRSIRRASHGARRANSTSVPQTWTTNGLPVAIAANPEGSQWACTRSAPAAARRAARTKPPSMSGSAAARYGRRRRLPTAPAPYAMP